MAVTSNDKYRKIGIIAVGVVVIVVIGILIALFKGRGYEATVEKFIDAQFDADMEAIMDLIPEEVVDKALEEEGYDSKEVDKFVKEANEELQEAVGYLKIYLGDKFNVSSEILGDKDITGDDLDEIKEDYAKIGVKVSDAKEVNVKITVKAGELEEDKSTEISVIKVGRSWYLDVQNMGSIF